MKTLIILITTIFMVACNKENVTNETTSNDYMYRDTKLDFIIVDSEGTNLLNSELKYDNIDVIIFEKGKEKVFYNPMLDASKGYFLNQLNSDTYLRLFLNLPNDGSTESFTYIRFNQGKINEVKAEFEINNVKTSSDGGSSIVIKKVWYNNTLFLDKTIGDQTVLPRITFE